MSLIDDIGNALSNVAGAVGNAMTTTVNAFTDTLSLVSNETPKRIVSSPVIMFKMPNGANLSLSPMS